MRERSNESVDAEAEQPMIRSRTSVATGSAIKVNRPGSAFKMRTSSNQKQRKSSINQMPTATTTATTLKDPRLTAVAQILDRKKINVDTGHMPNIGISKTGEKKPVGGIGEMTKRIVMAGSSAAPIKAKLMTTSKLTVKLKSS